MSRTKGQALERAFAAWMMSALHFTMTRQREVVKGDVATWPYEVDVHGERYNRFWYALHVIGTLLFAVAIAAIFLPQRLALITHATEATIAKIWPNAANLGVLILALVALFAGEFGRKRSTHHAWVECKNRSRKVGRIDIEKLRGAVDDVRKNEKASWKPDEVIIVSAAGFDDDAIALADEYMASFVINASAMASSASESGAAAGLLGVLPSPNGDQHAGRASGGSREELDELTVALAQSHVHYARPGSRIRTRTDYASLLVTHCARLDLQSAPTGVTTRFG